MRPPARRSRCFWGRIEGDRGRDPEQALVLVVLDFDVEVLEELCQVGGAVVVEGLAQIRDGGERGLDRFGMDVGRLVCLECREVLLESFALGGQFDDAALGEGDDGMGGIVVLFEAERLAVERAIDVGQLASAPGDLRFVLLPAASGGTGEFFMEMLEPSRTEEAGRQDVEQFTEDVVLLDAEHAWMSGCLGGGEAMAVDELAAVPVGALLVASRHPSPAESAADAPA